MGGALRRARFMPGATELGEGRRVCDNAGGVGRELAASSVDMQRGGVKASDGGGHNGLLRCLSPCGAAALTVYYCRSCTHQ